jgi:RimJ/RimL family protein N-acetyltransferase
MPDTIIHTPRLTLGPLREQDQAALIALFRHDGVKETYMVPDPLDDATAQRLFARMMALSRDDTRYVFGIFLGDALIGVLNDTEISGDTIEMGYALHPDHWNRGYMSEAFSTVINYLHTRGFTTVTAGAFEENVASLRVMQKCGMVRTEHTDQIEYRGKMHTCIYYTTA